MCKALVDAKNTINKKKERKKFLKKVVPGSCVLGVISQFFSVDRLMLTLRSETNTTQIVKRVFQNSVVVPNPLQCYFESVL